MRVLSKESCDSFASFSAGLHELTVAIQIPDLCQPIPRFIDGFEVFFLPFPTSCCKPCRIKPVLSLANALSAFFTFQIFAHKAFSFPTPNEKEKPT